jgi:myo-inositol 2-dehydrogenase/D-chiro-inositol 1-dehydrogenase
MQALRIGVIGAGGMGRRHAENLHRRVSGSRVSVVFEPSDANAAAALAICDGARRAMTSDALIAADDVDAVLIASPDETHAALAIDCIRAGRHVLCEKALAMSSADAHAVIAAEGAAGKRLLALGFMRRFDPQHVGVKDAVASGVIGRPILFKGVSRNQTTPVNHPVEILLKNSVIHDFDAMRWLMGRNVTRVFAQRIRVRDEADPDATDLLLAQLTLDDGSLATIEAYAQSNYGYDISAQVVCERGMAETRDDAVARVRRDNAVAEVIPPEWLTRFQPAYQREVQHWVDTLRYGVAWTGATAPDGLHAVRIAEACAASLASGRPEETADGGRQTADAGDRLEAS